MDILHVFIINVINKSNVRSAVAGFHARSFIDLSRSNSNLEIMVFQEGLIGGGSF